MPIIEFTYTTAPARTPEKMREVISRLTSAIVDSGIAPQEAVRVILREIPAEHFAAGDVTIAERRQSAAAASSEKGN